MHNWIGWGEIIYGCLQNLQLKIQRDAYHVQSIWREFAEVTTLFERFRKIHDILYTETQEQKRKNFLKSGQIGIFSLVKPQ